MVSIKVSVSVSKKIGLEKSFGFGFLFGENKENKKFDVMTYLVDRKVCVYEGDNLQVVEGLCHQMSVNH